MDIEHRVVFRIGECLLLQDYLDENQISYKKDEYSVVFYILNSSPHWPIVSEFVKKYQILCHSETIFTDEELYSASWLYVWSSWRYDYPQPEDSYWKNTYDDKKICCKCAQERVQQAPFRFKKPPKWGKRSFMSTNWVPDELFVSECTMNRLRQAGYGDISFCEVLNKSGKEIFPDIYQMKINQVLPPDGIVLENSCVKEVIVCPVCGRKQYGFQYVGQFVYKKETFFNAPDIVKSSEFFGWGHPSRNIYISQKMFRFIKENKMDASLNFEPLILV